MGISYAPLTPSSMERTERRRAELNWSEVEAERTNFIELFAEKESKSEQQSDMQKDYAHESYLIRTNSSKMMM